jgi:uncharacterized membrane protein YhiD involved in acid resistance
MGTGVRTAMLIGVLTGLFMVVGFAIGYVVGDGSQRRIPNK